MKNALKTNIPNREKLIAAIEEGDTEAIRKYGKRVGGKTWQKIKHRYGKGNPIVQLATKLGPKMLAKTPLGAAAYLGLNALSAKDLLEQAKEEW